MSSDGVPIKKLLIANRGEIAVRIIRAARELGIHTIQVHSTADADSLAVKLADEAIAIGPPQAAKSYLNIPAIIDAARKTQADAVHPGYGFLAENAEFADACAVAGLVFVGPSANAIRMMGDKVAAREAAMRAGVPTVPGSDGRVDDIEVARAVIAETAKLAGLVDGSIEAKTLIVHASARITGDVFYENITIENGGKVEGKLSHRRAGAAKAPPPLEIVANQSA